VKTAVTDTHPGPFLLEHVFAASEFIYFPVLLISWVLSKEFDGVMLFLVFGVFGTGLSDQELVTQSRDLKGSSRVLLLLMRFHNLNVF
jgi:hypothetical protein